MTGPNVGKPLNRVDGHLKVTGSAVYAAEHQLKDLVYAVVVQSTIAKGKISKIDSREADVLPGVIAVISCENIAKLKEREGNAPGRKLLLLQDNIIRYDRQHIALVVADTLETATYAASLIKITYEREKATTVLSDSLARELEKHDNEADVKSRGDFNQGLLQAQIKLENIYTTPVEHHNPMEPFAVIADWDGDNLTLYDTTQALFSSQAVVASYLGIEASSVRIVSPFVGGGFGNKLSTWSHVVLAAMAAKQVKRPLKLVLAREQMYGPVGYRPKTIQKIMLAADKEGRLKAIRHAGINGKSQFDDYVEAVASITRIMYSCPNLETIHKQKALDVGTPTWMRAPGEAPGSFALESAMDELAYELNIDPIELRLRNFADKDPESGLPWSSNSLKECYRLGAERFGWQKRNAKPKSMIKDGKLIGMGMAAATYPTYRMAASAKITLYSDGKVKVEAGSQDIGTGTYTIMTQIAADALGLAPEKIDFQLGDTNLPRTPLSGGSMTAASVGSAVHKASAALIAKLKDLLIADADSPFAGVKAEDIGFGDGSLFLIGDNKQSRSYLSIVQKHKLPSLQVEADAKPGEAEKKYAMHAFGAQFAEVEIDPDLCTISLKRIVSVISAGKILNPKTARSQIIGGITFGMGMALFEETHTDPTFGRIINADLAEYHLPVHADMPQIDVHFIDEHDIYINEIGAKGIGEIGITGVPAAIANAIYHATGKRVRDLPITLDKIM